jgi:hypothetical protein
MVQDRFHVWLGTVFCLGHAPVGGAEPSIYTISSSSAVMGVTV